MKLKELASTYGIGLTPLIILIFPIYPKYYLNGYPFDNIYEVLLFILFLFLFVNKAHINIQPKTRVFIFIVTTFIILGSLLNSDNFYNSCFKTNDTPVSNFEMNFTTENNCQFSFREPFNSKITKKDYYLSFNKDPINNKSIEYTNWDLHFFNQTGFNFYNKELYGGKNDLSIKTHWALDLQQQLKKYSYLDLEKENLIRYDYGFNNIIYPLEPSRSWLPFSVKWFSTSNTYKSQDVVIKYVGEGAIYINDRKTLMPPAYNSENTLTIFIPENTKIEIEYLYRFSGLENSIPNIPYASFNLLNEKNEKINIYETNFEKIVMVINLVLFIFLFFIYLFSLNYKNINIFLHLSFFGTVLYFLELLPNLYADYFEILLLFIVFLLFSLKKVNSPNSVFSFMLLIAISSIKNLNNNSETLYSIGGSDPLKYESWAQQIIFSKSLQGGEDIYLYQPGYRYLLSLSRLVFGDSHLSLVLFSRFLFVLMIFLIFIFLIQKSNINNILLGFNFLILYILLSTYSSKQNLFSSLSEWPTWLFGTMLFYFMINKDLIIKLPYIPPLLLGLIFLIRENQLIGLICLILFFFTCYDDLNNKIFFILIFIGLFLIPFIHNYFYGGLFILEKNIFRSDVYYLPPLDLLFNFQAVTETLKFQLDFLFANPLSFGVRTMAGKILPVTISIIIFQWMSLFLISKKNIKNFLYFFIPIGFLGPHLFYQVHTYFPRHIIQGYLFMLFSTVLLLLNKNEFNSNE